MGKILVVQIKDSRYKKIKFEFKNEYNLEDYTKLIALFEILEEGFNAPIRKAIENYLLQHKRIFPI